MSQIDRTLLGVIGVLDELAWQDNVSGWIRADGLWAGFKATSTEVNNTTTNEMAPTAVHADETDIQARIPSSLKIIRWMLQELG